MIRFLKEGLPTDKVDFGITEQNQSNRITVSYINEYEDVVEFTDPQINDDDVKLLEYTKNLKSGEIGKAILEFTPKDRKKGLEEGFLKFRVVIGK